MVVADWLGIVDVLYYEGDKPYKKYGGDAGFDLRVAERIEVMPSDGVDVPVETVATSRRMWFLLLGRSSTFYDKGLMVFTAVIDTGYTGKLNIFVYNTTGSIMTLKRGERIGQIIPIRLNRMMLMKGRFAKKGGRGTKGFGSTGKN